MVASELAELLPQGWVAGEVMARRDWTGELFTLTVGADVEPFVAGQFLRLGLVEEDRFVSRAYSVASAPGAPLEFFVALVREGALTPALHELGPGDALAVTARAAGHFTLEHVSVLPALWLIATGTGLAPYLSMLRAGELWARWGRVVLVHGVRTHADLAYGEEIRQLCGTRGLIYLPVVSREPPQDGVFGGRIPQQIAALEAAAGVALAPESSHVLLCGNPAMIEEMDALLAARGMGHDRPSRPGNVTIERYW